jgi:hypothetical protein
MGHPIFKDAGRHDDVCVVDILRDDLLPMRQIADSDVVVSQSLHGLIYAESLGKPSLWISHRSDDIWRFKFDDWFTTTYNPQVAPADMSGDLDELIGAAQLRYSSIRKPELLSAFPSEVAEPPSPERMDFEACRAMETPLVFMDEDWLDGAAFGNQHQPAFERIDRMRAALFANWAEKPYCTVATAKTRKLPTAEQRRVITADLDRRASVDFAFCLPVQEASYIAVSDTVRLHPGLKTSGPVIVMRPVAVPASENYAVYGIA